MKKELVYCLVCMLAWIVFLKSPVKQCELGACKSLDVVRLVETQSYKNAEKAEYIQGMDKEGKFWVIPWHNVAGWIIERPATKGE